MINLRRISSSQTKPTDGGSAFTLTELMVVIGVVVLLAATLLPALAQSKMKSQAVVCLSHMRQLQRAALLYASDNNDFCPVNSALSPVNGGDSTTGRPCWVDGTFSSPAAGDNPAGCSINPFYLGVVGIQGTGTGFRGNGGPIGLTLIGSIGPYVRSAAAYRCPADHFIDPTYRVLRVRSYSANMEVGHGAGYLPLAGYKAFEKYTDFGSPLAPSQCFEFLDENPVSLTDGYFAYYQDGSRINDQPAANHDLATSFSFADGHSALHIWRDVFLKYQSNLNQNGLDTMWLAQHGTYRIQ